MLRVENTTWDEEKDGTDGTVGGIGVDGTVGRIGEEVLLYCPYHGKPPTLFTWWAKGKIK